MKFPNDLVLFYILIGSSVVFILLCIDELGLKKTVFMFSLIAACFIAFFAGYLLDGAIQFINYQWSFTQ